MLQFPCKPMKCKKTNAAYSNKRIVEVKKDGDRTFAVKAGNDAKLFSSIGNDVSQKYPEVLKALDHLQSDNFILDGEIVAVDGSWESLHKRSDTGISDSSVVFQVFDTI